LKPLASFFSTALEGGFDSADLCNRPFALRLLLTRMFQIHAPGDGLALPELGVAVFRPVLFHAQYARQQGLFRRPDRGLVAKPGIRQQAVRLYPRAHRPADQTSR